jgi:hypothetical protein
MALSVIGAGLPRTGTASLKRALQELGFNPCYHMSEAFAHPAHWAMWTDAAEGRPVDWDTLFDGYRAAVDAPTCLFYRELAAHYPDAKFILSTRDPELWFSSTQATVLSTDIVARRGPRPPELDHMMRAIGWHQDAPGAHDKDALLARYHSHNESVRRTIPRERLLEFTPSQGWEPLCAFLGVAIPPQQFPNVNARAEFRKMADNAKTFDPQSVRRSHAEQLAERDKKV